MARNASRIVSLALTLGVSAMGCGRGTDASLSNSALETSPDSEPMIVAMGGYNSCGSEDPKKIMETLEGTSPENLPGSRGSGPRGMGMFQKFNALKNKLRDKYGIESRYIISCFTSAAAAYYRSSASPDELKTVETKDYPNLVGTHMRRGSPLYMIGHSHGGWLAIKNTLALANEVSVDALFSSDPISRVYCRPPAITGCTGFPQDITKNNQEEVKGTTGYWLNAWQSQTFYLHSGPSGSADDNMKISAGHTAMDNHVDLWAKIDAKVTERL